jgi:[ribosomal protein S5]-alanine N-acetyltransferase
MVNPMLKSKRLILRNYTPSDREFFVSLNSNSVVREHMDGALSEEQAADFFQNQVLQNSTAFVIALKTDPDTLIGHIFINREAQTEPFPELGYMLAQQYWGQGFATEAVGLLLLNQSSDQKRFFATCDLDHPGSYRVLEKCGFSKIREIHDDGVPYAVYHYSTLKPESD